MPEPKKPLSELEHLVMEVVWQRDSVTTEDVRGALAESHPIKEPTIRTILSRLEDKGHVTHCTQGRANIYSGTDAPQNVAAHSVRRIIERFCGGSVERLLIGLVNNEVIDEKELQRLAQLIARRKKNPKE